MAPPTPESNRPEPAGDQGRRRVLPPTCFLAALVLMAMLHWLAPLWGPVGLPWRLLGLVPLAGGLAWAIRAEQFFKRAGTTVKPFERSSRLVTDGPFGFSRHPMYLGMTLALAGVALLLGTATPPVGVVLFGAVISLRFIPAEERAMERTFGEEYRRYRSRVRRWL